MSGHMTSTSRGSRAGVGLEQAEHSLAQHFHLPVRPVAGVHLHGGVGDGERDDGRTVVAQCPLQPAQQRGRRLGAGVVLVDEAGHGRGEPHLQLPDVAPERGQERVRRDVGRRVGRARRHPTRSDLGPKRGRGVRQPQVDRPVLAQRREDRELLRGEAGGPEERQPLGKRVTPGSARRAAHAASTRSMGSGPPIRARSRRHSSGCHTRSASTSSSSPPRQLRSSSGRWAA